MPMSRTEPATGKTTRPGEADTGSHVTLVAVLLGVTVVWGLWPLIITLGLQWWPEAKSMEVLGQSGDMFGSLTALFTALAFGAVWWTGWLQRKALAIQAQDLAAQQEEIRHTRAVMARQMFDSRFFKMLDLLETRNRNIRVADAWGGEAKKDIAGYISGASGSSADQGLAAVMATWRQHGEDNPASRTSIEAWLATLSVTLAVVDDPANGLVDVDRRTYANILKASLDEADLMIIACNALMWATLDPLVVKYGTLGNLYDETLRSGVRKQFPGVVFDW